MSKAAEPAQGRSRLVLKCKITPTGGLAVLCAACCASKYAKQHLFISLLASSQISEGAFGGGERAMLRHLRQYSTRLAVQRGAKQSEGGSQPRQVWGG